VIAPTFSGMRGGWKRFGLYLVVVAALIGLVVVATRGEPRTAALVAAQVLFVAGMSYLLTFIVWPRRVPRSAAQPSMQNRRPPGPSTKKQPRPEVDRRPVAVINPRPAGSKPGSRVHIPESPTERGSRGRRPDRRQPTGEIRWPAQR